jgi:hypothetical protein
MSIAPARKWASFEKRWQSVGGLSYRWAGTEDVGIRLLLESVVCYPGAGTPWRGIPHMHLQLNTMPPRTGESAASYVKRRSTESALYVAPGIGMFVRWMRNTHLFAHMLVPGGAQDVSAASATSTENLNSLLENRRFFLWCTAAIATPLVATTTKRWR